MPQTQPPRAGKKWLKVILMAVGVVLIVGVGGSAAAYRFAPQTFFRLVPPALSSKVNAFWPLHHSFADMVPANTVVFGSANLSATSAQAKQLQTLLTRIPGLDASDASVEKGLDTILKDQFDLTFSSDIKPAFGETLYFALPGQAGNESNFALGIPIKDLAKANTLLSKLKNSTKTGKLFSDQQTVNGVTVYVTKPTTYTPAAVGTSLQSLNKLIGRDTTAVATNTTDTTKPCTGKLTACADSSTPIANTGSTALTLAVMDRHVVIADSLKTMTALINQSHSRAATLASQSSFTRLNTTGGLFSIFVNPEALATDSQTKGLKALYNGVTGSRGTLSAETTGFQIKGDTYYDAKKLDPLLAKIVSVPDKAFEYDRSLPDSTAFFAEGAAFNHNLNLLGSLSFDDKQSVDDLTVGVLGIKLSELGAVTAGDYVISYQPDAKSALVLQAEVTDADQAKAVLNKLRDYLASTYAATVDIKDQAIGDTTGTVISFKDPLLSTKDYFQPTFLLHGTQIVVASNVAGATSAVTVPANALANDPQLKEDQQIVGSAARVFWHLNTKRFYHGIVNAVRDLTSNTDLAQSDQERVIDAYLDVFPSLTSAIHTNKDVSNSVATMPVKELDAARKAEIDQLIKTKGAEIFNVVPFLTPFSATSSSSSNSSSDSTTTHRKSDIQNIVRAVVTGNIDNSNFSKYQTSGDEKLDPASGVMKQMLTSGDLLTAVQDPDAPDYYYTLNNDGNVVRVTTLTINKYDLSASNCQEPKQIRSRWTFCVEQK